MDYLEDEQMHFTLLIFMSVAKLASTSQSLIFGLVGAIKDTI